MSQNSSPRRWLLVLVLLLVAGGGLGLFLWQQYSLDDSSVAELIALKDRANGFAENAKYAEADQVLQELAKRLPDEPLVRRNLAIVRIGPLESLSEEDLLDPQKRATITPAELVVEAVNALVQAEPNDPASQIMQARAAIQLNRVAPDAAANLPDPLDSLKKAVELDPKDAAARFELYELVVLPRYRDDAQAQEAGRKAIAEAYALQPRNMTLFLELVKTQVDAQDPALADTLANAEDLLRPVRPLILKNHGHDIEQVRKDGVQAVKDNNWGAVQRTVRPVLFNLINPQMIQRVDRPRVKVGALEYLRHDFSDQFYQQYGRPSPPPFPATTVKFAADDATFPPLNAIRDLRLADVDLDGRLELVVLHGETLSILWRSPGSKNWEPLLEAPVPAEMQRLIVADLDRDVARLQVAPAETPQKEAKEESEEPPQPDGPGPSDKFRLLQACSQAFPDFLLYGPGGVAIIRNENAGEREEFGPSGGGLRKLTPISLAEEVSQIGHVTAAVVVDFDHDQDLDLVLAVEGQGIRLWRMTGNGTFKFEDYTHWSSLPAKEGRVSDLAVVDFNRDLFTDVVASYESQNAKGETFLSAFLLANQRHGQFIGADLGREYAALDNAAAIAPIELDGNVSWDLVALNEAGIQTVLTTTSAPGLVRYQQSLPAASVKGRRLLTWDYDNDTYPDLLVWGEDGATILRGTPSEFVPLQPNLVAGIPTTQLVAIDYGDLDDDHDLDLIAATADKLVQITNAGGNANRCLTFFVTGDFDGQNIGASNSAVGTTVETRTPGRYQAQVVTRQPVHVGLGGNSKADLVRLIFTNGIPRSAASDKVDQLFCEKQILHGSCPFIYTWTGERFEFFSDCLWAAPIGMQVAEGKMAPSRAWEYLLIPGGRLQERDGTYDLQLTEELWEATYFDVVKLIAVDHPAGTDLYTNEKVGGPDIAAPKLHLVQQPRRPVAARDKHGRDVLEIVSRRDDDYLRGFDRHITQGLVDEHFLELDLGPLEPAPKLITLFLTGWIYPTNTSINVSLSQDPDRAYPRHPYVQVADGEGGWREVQAFMGFPGGKTKTIAVEIAGDVFRNGQYQLRIGTSAEIYWDDVFFTVDEAPIVGPAPQLVQEQTLELVSADLHYRGFSAELPRRSEAPLRFDYSRVQTDPKWPPMGGYFTRYGDVQPLLKTLDDQMVVIGSGDEMTVRFQAPPQPPPPGWKRDFILYSVGWDKDADLNTIYGQEAEPLPYNAMPSYPYPADQWFPDTPAHRSYLQKYQTRQQDFQRFWRQLAP